MDQRRGDSFPSPRMPMALFALNIVYLGLLGALLTIYVRQRGWEWDWDPRGAAPISWFGMLGACVASFIGLTKNARKWNRDWNLWYVVRPVLGGVFGAVGYLIYIAIVQASITDSNTNSNKHPTILALVIAFALGYREETFRDLIRRVVDLVATGGNADIEPPSSPTALKVYEDLSADGKVAFSWEPATDNVGVVGYNIYRNGHFLSAVRCEPSTAGVDGPRRPSMSFVDGSASGDATDTVHYYSVTAVDRAGNESEPVGPIAIRRTSKASKRLDDGGTAGERLIKQRSSGGGEAGGGRPSGDE